MDSDGYIDEFGRCEFVSIRERLADGCRRVGGEPRAPAGEAEEDACGSGGIEHGVAYQVKFTPRIPVFRLERKLAQAEVGTLLIGTGRSSTFVR